MDVFVNGVSTNVESGFTVSGLLNKMNINQDRVAVEINLDVVKKKDYPNRLLKEKDKIEIVHFVGGG